MEKKENPQLTPSQYKEALDAQLKALRKIRKIYRKDVLKGSILYHTSLRNLNKQIHEVLDELINLHRDYPETKISFKDRFKESFLELAKAASEVKTK